MLFYEAEFPYISISCRLESLENSFKMIKIVFLICLALSTIEADEFITFKDTKEDPCGADPFYIACSEVKYWQN